MKPEERQQYSAWLELRRPLLEARQWTEALRDWEAESVASSQHQEVLP